MGRSQASKFKYITPSSSPEVDCELEVLKKRSLSKLQEKLKI